MRRSQPTNKEMIEIFVRRTKGSSIPGSVDNSCKRLNSCPSVSGPCYGSKSGPTGTRSSRISGVG